MVYDTGEAFLVYFHEFCSFTNACENQAKVDGQNIEKYAGLAANVCHTHS